MPEPNAGVDGCGDDDGADLRASAGPLEKLGLWTHIEISLHLAVHARSAQCSNRAPGCLESAAGPSPAASHG